MSFIYNFKGYKISYSKSAEKTLKKIDPRVAHQIEQKFKNIINGLPNNDIKRLQGANRNNVCRLRVGNFRALFEIKEHEIAILVISIDHRKDVYKNY